MKTRTQCFMIAGLVILILAVGWLGYSTRNQEPAQVFSATINRDCAPWDGGAFTVSIPVDVTTTIMISIWQSPDIQHPIAFTFPDESGQTGFVYILPEIDPLQPLSGEVFFGRVEQGLPVEGEFNLTTERGEQFNGRFKAVWGDQVVYCG
ncbi:MAG TPA: hypothetical protein VFQ23_08625 [Anaerolineales bacterium]|nr:hypothetical protein [Anaerolineales bacterium]